MSAIFISHASLDDHKVARLLAWLKHSGFEDVFIDHCSIAGGASWRSALQDALRSAQVVLCLVTENWLDSPQCMAEYDASFYMGKRVIPLFMIEVPIAPGSQRANRFNQLRQHYQGIDLRSEAHAEQNGEADWPEFETALGNALVEAGASRNVGVDPAAFAIDRSARPVPFPGLSSFGDTDADAALFFGRGREINKALEEIRAMRARMDPRPFVILGASGAGKSSLLKAGLIPRLRREAPAWLPLRVFRPGAEPVYAFSEALAQTLTDYGDPAAAGTVRDALLQSWRSAKRKEGLMTQKGRKKLADQLEAFGSRLRQKSGRLEATILISMDQAEEIARSDEESAEALGDYLRAAMERSSGYFVAMTMRTDNFIELQGSRRFHDIEAHPFDLRPPPTYRFGNIIEEPARRYGVRVEEAMVAALMADAPNEDALPLIAFALQRLWRQYAQSGALTLENYVNAGGVKGVIEFSAECAMRGLSPDDNVNYPAPPSAAQLELAASTFLPALAQINESGRPVRAIASWDTFSEAQKALLQHFEQWRLIVRKNEDGKSTVEVTHEALFREWSRFASWFAPERKKLEILRSVKTDASLWSLQRSDETYLNHRGRRLKEAEAVEADPNYGERLSALDVDYIRACRNIENKRRDRRLIATGIALAVSILAAIVGQRNAAAAEEAFNWYFFGRPFKQTEVHPYVLSREAERNLKPGDHFRECRRFCPEMVVVPPGAFEMGAPANDSEQYPNETPRHRVRISKPFAVGKFAVTVDEWNACVGARGCPRPMAGETFGGSDHPMIDVSWRDAQIYTAWFSKMSGKKYRLLTEAEWEYAARARTNTRYSWGDEIGIGNSNCMGCGSKWDNRSSAPSGSFAPNAFGLFDMSGNVWQWVEDCVPGDGDGDYKLAPNNGEAYNPGNCTRHFSRGGSFIRLPRNLRVTSRYPSSTDQHSIYHGFRVARSLD